jgi:hypothetical protein
MSLKHLGRFVAFGQSDLSIGPESQGFGGSHKARLIAGGDRQAQMRRTEARIG